MAQATKLEPIAEESTSLVASARRSFRHHLAHCVGGHAAHHVVPLCCSIVQHLAAERDATLTSGQHVQAMIGRGMELLADLSLFARHIDQLETQAAGGAPPALATGAGAPVPIGPRATLASSSEATAAASADGAPTDVLGLCVLSSAVGATTPYGLAPVLWGIAARRWNSALFCAATVWLACDVPRVAPLLLLGGAVGRLGTSTRDSALRGAAEVALASMALWCDVDLVAQLCLFAFAFM